MVKLVDTGDLKSPAVMRASSILARSTKIFIILTLPKLYLMAIKYLPIWEALKKDSKVVLAVPVKLREKVLKEVIRIKDLDVMFKFEASEKRKSYRLSYTSEGARITIVMTEFTVLKELDPEEL